jgi:hypothetical protein
MARLIERNAVRGDGVAFGDANVLGHAAVDMDTEHADVLATIGLAVPAGHTGAAGEIRDHIDLLTGRDGATGTGGRDLAGQLVPDDARISQVRMRALVDVEVRAADAGAANSDQHFPGSCSGLRPVNDDKISRPHALQRPHATSLPPEWLCLLSTKNVLPGDKSNCFLYKKLNSKNSRGDNGRRK